jgi:acid phosphatase
MRRAHFPLFCIIVCAACASAPPAATATPAPTAEIPTAVRWARTAAEHRAIFLQTYRAAGDQLRELVRGRAPGAWGVIIDADETVLDNSAYQLRIAQRGERFDIDTWNAWVRERAADSLPGAAGFIRLANQLGGRVVMVTNREEVVCDATRANLRRLTIDVAAVLCQQPGERGKGARFAAVMQGAPRSTLPPLDVVMFVGDNVQDFPDMTQELRTAPDSAFARFGSVWFLLPNAMYGSFERNEIR